MKGTDEAGIEDFFRKIGNAFQNIGRTRKILVDLLGGPPEGEIPWDELNAAFEKRHPITHNLGVVDRKYIERAKSGDQHGREIRVTAEEIKNVLGYVLLALSTTHQAMRMSGDARSEDSAS